VVDTDGMTTEANKIRVRMRELLGIQVSYDAAINNDDLSKWHLVDISSQPDGTYLCTFTTG